MSTNTHIDQLHESAAMLFKNTFDRAVSWIAAAPGRVNLIGEHVDYNDGIVLPFAIDRYSIVASAANDSSLIRLRSDQFDDVVEIDINELKPIDGCWTNYVCGVVAEFQKRDVDVPGFDAVVSSNVPLGAGLSSSAALEVATATFLQAMTGTNLSKREQALLCQSAEHNFAGVPCGIMDQFASTFGVEDNLIRIDCQNQEIELIPTIGSEDFVFLVINSLAQHELVDGGYSARKQQSASALKKIGKTSYRQVTLDDIEKTDLTEVEVRRARHVVTEIDRTEQTIQKLQAGQWGGVGELLYASHDSLRDDYQVSCVELDFLVQCCKSIGEPGGFLGSRMTGGGFGGCTISIVRRDVVEEVTAIIQKQFSEKFGSVPPVFATRPSAGAHLI